MLFMSIFLDLSHDAIVGVQVRVPCILHDLRVPEARDLSLHKYSLPILASTGTLRASNQLTVPAASSPCLGFPSPVS